MSTIELKNVSVQFKQKKRQITAVNQVSLKVEKGEIFGIVGLSGAGKSTVVRTMNLLQVPTSGQVLIDGQDITAAKGQALGEIRKRVGMIFQHFNLISNRTIGDNILFALKAANYPKEQRQERVKELLELVDLSDKIADYPANLSGGQKQRVGIARALANKPDILLCDEATSALDVETTEEIINLLEKINQELNLTIVFITHQMEVAKRLFHRLAVMQNGEIVEQNRTFEIFGKPQHEFTQKLVGRHMNLVIPQELVQKFRTGVLLELTYLDDNALEPLIANVSRQIPVLVSITHGKIEYIQGKAIGRLIIHVDGEPEEIKRAIEMIQGQVDTLKLVGEEEGS
ncbi:ATP-binding cassette domain-containing protein [Vagococcus sp. BWB3-3]|uniref:ATP-binding cassette domain-containing protein n=1 Tax=Vagococcus allomyrinae TaxID=2794353 RepID=A0A940SY94_9ENTE|nr:ATP-binding cassette domain-containing protein [Vagococcus allomyrinae]MBP1044201.1 ATP-binding cassette domain-containing protein [Vagococcus allomyrinae]